MNSVAPALRWQLRDAGDSQVATWSINLTAEQANELRRGLVETSTLHAWTNQSGRLTDLMSLGFAGLFAMSERLAGVFRNLTGQHLYPIRLGAEGSTYYVLGVTGRCGSVDFGQSEIVDRMGGFAFLRGLALTQATDNDADVTMPDNLDVVLVSNRAADAIVALAPNNVLLEPIAEVVIPLAASRIRDTNSRQGD